MAPMKKRGDANTRVVSAGIKLQQTLSPNRNTSLKKSNEPGKASSRLSKSPTSSKSDQGFSERSSRSSRSVTEAKLTGTSPDDDTKKHRQSSQGTSKEENTLKNAKSNITVASNSKGKTGSRNKKFSQVTEASQDQKITSQNPPPSTRSSRSSGIVKNNTSLDILKRGAEAIVKEVSSHELQVPVSPAVSTRSRRGNLSEPLEESTSKPVTRKTQNDIASAIHTQVKNRHESRSSAIGKNISLCEKNESKVSKKASPEVSSDSCSPGRLRRSGATAKDVKESPKQNQSNIEKPTELSERKTAVKQGEKKKAKKHDLEQPEPSITAKRKRVADFKQKTSESNTSSNMTLRESLKPGKRKADAALGCETERGKKSQSRSEPAQKRNKSESKTELLANESGDIICEVQNTVESMPSAETNCGIKQEDGTNDIPEFSQPVDNPQAVTFCKPCKSKSYDPEVTLAVRLLKVEHALDQMAQGFKNISSDSNLEEDSEPKHWHGQHRKIKEEPCNSEEKQSEDETLVHNTVVEIEVDKENAFKTEEILQSIDKENKETDTEVIDKTLDGTPADMNVGNKCTLQDFNVKRKEIQKEGLETKEADTFQNTTFETKEEKSFQNVDVENKELNESSQIQCCESEETESIRQKADIEASLKISMKSKEINETCQVMQVRSTDVDNISEEEKEIKKTSQNIKEVNKLTEDLDIENKKVKKEPQEVNFDANETEGIFFTSDLYSANSGTEWEEVTFVSQKDNKDIKSGDLKSAGAEFEEGKFGSQKDDKDNKSGDLNSAGSKWEEVNFVSQKDEKDKSGDLNNTGTEWEEIILVSEKDNKDNQSGDSNNSTSGCSVEISKEKNFRDYEKEDSVVDTQMSVLNADMLENNKASQFDHIEDVNIKQEISDHDETEFTAESLVEDIDIKQEDEIEGFEVVAEWSSLRCNLNDREDKSDDPPTAHDWMGFLGYQPELQQTSSTSETEKSSVQELGKESSCSGHETVKDQGVSTESESNFDLQQEKSSMESSCASASKNDMSQTEDVVITGVEVASETGKASIARSETRKALIERLLQKMCSPKELIEISKSVKDFPSTGEKTPKSVNLASNNTETQIVLSIDKDKRIWQCYPSVEGKSLDSEKTPSDQAQIKIHLASGKTAIINLKKQHESSSKKSFEEPRKHVSLPLRFHVKGMDSNNAGEKANSPDSAPPLVKTSENIKGLSKELMTQVSMTVHTLPRRRKERTVPGLLVYPSKLKQMGQNSGLSLLGKSALSASLADCVSLKDLQGNIDKTSTQPQTPSDTDPEAKKDNCSSDFDSNNPETPGLIVPRPYGRLTTAGKLFFDEIEESCPLSPGSKAFAETLIKQRDFLEDVRHCEALEKIGLVPITLDTVELLNSDTSAQKDRLYYNAATTSRQKQYKKEKTSGNVSFLAEIPKFVKGESQMTLLPNLGEPSTSKVSSTTRDQNSIEVLSDLNSETQHTNFPEEVSSNVASTSSILEPTTGVSKQPLVVRACYSKSLLKANTTKPKSPHEANLGNPKSLLETPKTLTAVNTSNPSALIASTSNPKSPLSPSTSTTKSFLATSTSNTKSLITDNSPTTNPLESASTSTFVPQSDNAGPSIATSETCTTVTTSNVDCTTVLSSSVSTLPFNATAQQTSSTSPVSLIKEIVEDQLETNKMETSNQPNKILSHNDKETNCIDITQDPIQKANLKTNTEKVVIVSKSQQLQEVIVDTSVIANSVSSTTSCNLQTVVADNSKTQLNDSQFVLSLPVNSYSSHGLEDDYPCTDGVIIPRKNKHPHLYAQSAQAASKKQTYSPEDMEDDNPDGVTRPRKSQECPCIGCDGTGHITGQYTHHRSFSGCPRRGSLPLDPTESFMKSQYAFNSKAHANDKNQSEEPEKTYSPEDMEDEYPNTDGVIIPRKSRECPCPGCDGTGHITGQYTHHRSFSGCPKRASLPLDVIESMVKSESVKCPTIGCNGRGHINNNRSTHRSVSGCPLAAMNKLMTTKPTRHNMHVVVLPKSDDPTKAMIASCSERELIRLAAKEITPAVTDRVLRPMILTKQLEPRDSKLAPQVTPRGNLAKELEKYSRPELSLQSLSSDSTFQAEANDKSGGCNDKLNPYEPIESVREAVRNAPVRPNILSRRPHIRHKVNMLSRARPGGSTGNKILDAAAAVSARSSSPSSISSSSSSSLLSSSPASAHLTEQLSASSNLSQRFPRKEPM